MLQLMFSPRLHGQLHHFGCYNNTADIAGVSVASVLALLLYQSQM